MNRPDFSLTDFPPYDSETLPLPDGDLWVFGYGSLMWNPGFPHDDARPARLYGYHRRLCLWSVHYRGTREQPGLVLGLDRGGSCNGMAFRVDSRHMAAALEYLKEREMLSNAYVPGIKTVYPEASPPRQALTFVSRQDHPQFAGPMSVGQTAAIVSSARGDRGDNEEYVLNTVDHLAALGIHQAELCAVADRLRR